MVERNAAVMFILYDKVLLENQVDDTVNIWLSVLMLILKDMFTYSIIHKHKKIENTKPENFKEKSPNSPMELPTVLLEEELWWSLLISEKVVFGLNRQTRQKATAAT